MDCSAHPPAISHVASPRAGGSPIWLALLTGLVSRARFGNPITGSKRTILYIGRFPLSRPVRIFSCSFQLTRHSVEYLSRMYHVCYKMPHIWPRRGQATMTRFPISFGCVSAFARPFDDEPSPLYRHSSSGPGSYLFSLRLTRVSRHRSSLPSSVPANASTRRSAHRTSSLT